MLKLQICGLASISIRLFAICITVRIAVLVLLLWGGRQRVKVVIAYASAADKQKMQFSKTSHNSYCWYFMWYYSAAKRSNHVAIARTVLSAGIQNPFNRSSIEKCAHANPGSTSKQASFYLRKWGFRLRSSNVASPRGHESTRVSLNELWLFPAGASLVVISAHALRLWISLSIPYNFLGLPPVRG